MEKLDFKNLPVIIKRGGPLSGFIVSVMGVGAICFGTLILNIYSVERLSWVHIALWIEILIGFLMFLLGILVAGRRTIVEIDHHYIFTKYTGPFHHETDWVEPVSAYTCVLLGYEEIVVSEYPIFGISISYPVTLLHPDPAKDILLDTFSNESMALQLLDDATYALELPAKKIGLDEIKHFKKKGSAALKEKLRGKS